jgi:hypothetical protein
VINGPATLTTYAQGTNFGGYTTFAIPNAVTQVVGIGSSPPTFTCDSSPTSTSILTAIATNLKARGYTQSDTIICQGNNPQPTADLAINVSVMKVNNTYYAYYPCYWWGYWGYPSYGCYYPYTWVSSYTTGTLVTQMSDLKNKPPPGPGGGAIEDLWAAVGYSVLSGSTQTGSAAAVASISQAFAQSPYLHTP